MALISGTSKVEIVSQALTLIGNPRPTNNLNDDPVVVSVSKLYDTLIYDMLTKTYWRFAIQNFSLNKLAGNPINTYWSFAYQLPPDYLTLLRIYKAGQKGNFTDYQIYQDEIWTNQDVPLIADYIFDPGPEFYPAYFVQLMIYQLAANIALPVAQNVQLMEVWTAKAEKYYQEARSRDRNAMPNIPIQRNDIYGAHFGL